MSTVCSRTVTAGPDWRSPCAFLPYSPRALVFAGCLSVTATQLGPPSLGTDRPRIAPDQVAVYRAEEYAPEDYDEWRSCTSQDLSLVHRRRRLRKMQEEAARLGANAVILQPVREMSGRQKVKARELNLDMGRRVARSRSTCGRAGRCPSGRGARRKPALPRRSGRGFLFDPARERDARVRRVDRAVEVGQIKAILPDGTTRCFSSARVRWVTDRDGRDWTRWVVDERRRLACDPPVLAGYRTRTIFRVRDSPSAVRRAT